VSRSLVDPPPSLPIIRDPHAPRIRRFGRSQCNVCGIALWNRVDSYAAVCPCTTGRGTIGTSIATSQLAHPARICKSSSRMLILGSATCEFDLYSEGGRRKRKYTVNDSDMVALSGMAATKVAKVAERMMKRILVSCVAVLLRERLRLLA